MKGKEIEKALDYLMDACVFINEDCGACGGCPLKPAFCLWDSPYWEIAELNADHIDEFLKFAHDGKAESWRWDNMDEYERRENYEAEIANLERSSYDD